MSASPVAASQKKPLYKDLFFQVITSIILGILLGYFLPEWGVAMKPLGEAFINLIKMMIAPIIFCTIVTGIAGMGNMKQVGRVGVKALFYFEVITTIALIMGLVVMNLLTPGADMNINQSSVDISSVKEKVAGAHMQSTTEFLMNIIPHTFVSAFAHGEILQVLLISVLFAWALSAMGDKGRPIVQFIDNVSHVLFGMIGIISKLAPLGAFGAMAFTVGKYGVSSLIELGELVSIFYATCIVFILVVLGGVMRFYCRLSLIDYLKYIREELIIVLGTSSSETVLPRMIDKMTHMGCSKPVVGMVIPTGYSFNLDGTSIYLTMGALFIGYATGQHLDIWEQLSLLGILLLTSKGAAGVTGSGFIVLAATLASMKVIPQADLDVGLALIFAIDRFMSTGRALTNMIGNGIATIAVAKWENALNYSRASGVLQGKIDPRLEVN